MVSTVGPHHSAEVLRRGAVFGGVDVLLGDQAADVSDGEFRPNLHALVEISGVPVNQTTAIASFDWTRDINSSRPGRDMRWLVI